MSHGAGLLPLGAIFGFVFYMAQIEIKDLDLWLHIGVGKFITLNRYVPAYDILSHTIAGTPWINHEWLFQVIVYNIYQAWGPDGLIQMQVGIVTLTMLLLLFLGYNKDKQLILAFVLFLVGMVYSQRFTIRPDIYSLFFFVFYIFVLALHIDKKWATPALVIIQILWTNIHGFFFFGPLFVLIGLMSEGIKRHVKLPWEWNASGRLTNSEFRRLKFIFILVVLACMVNPYTLKGAWYPIGVFFSFSGENKVFFQHIQELQKPVTLQTLWTGGDFITYKLLIMLSIISFIFNRRRIDISALLFWLVFLVFSLQAARNAAFFAFAAYLVILTNLINISYKDIVPLRFTGKNFLYLTSTVVKLWFVIWIFNFAEGLAANGYYDFDRYERKSEYGGVSKRSYPDKAVDFLVQNNIQGNFFNDFNSGAYLVGRAFPRIRVFIDGRTEVYGGKFFEKYRKIWEDGDVGLFEEMVKKHNISGAFLNSVNQHIPDKILNYLYAHKDWKPVYFNYDGLVFLRDVPQNKAFIERWAIDLSHWQPIKLDLLKIGSSPVQPYQFYFRAFTLESLGLHEPALAEAMEAIKIAPGYAEVCDLIGKIYTERKEYEKAFEHFRIAAIGQSNNPKVRHNLALCYFDMGAYEGAIKQYLRIIEMWPGQPKAYFLLAKVYAKDKQYDKAMEILKNAHKLGPQDARDVLGIGDILYEQGNYEKAQEAYQLAIKTGKDLSLAHKKLGFVYKVIGDSGKAAEEFRQSLALDPADEEVKKELGQPASSLEKEGK
jgi:tetratricopeptide (TPR) repeat protein